MKKDDLVAEEEQHRERCLEEAESLVKMTTAYSPQKSNDRNHQNSNLRVSLRDEYGRYEQVAGTN